jgi:hypothetical protein
MWPHISARIFAREGRPVVGVISQYRTFSFTSHVSSAYLIVLPSRVSANHINNGFNWILQVLRTTNMVQLQRPNHSKNAVSSYRVVTPLQHPCPAMSSLGSDPTGLSSSLKLPSCLHRQDVSISYID